MDVIAQCSTCGRTFEAKDTGPQFCPHCGTHVYIEAPGEGAGTPPPGGETPPGGEGYTTGPYGQGNLPPGGELPPGGGGHGSGDGKSPFERRDQTGFVGGFVETVKLALIDPRRLFSGMGVDDPGSAFLFGWLCLSIGGIAGSLWNTLSNRFTRTTTFSAEDLRDLPPEFAELLERFAESAGEGGQLLIGIVLTPVFAAIGLLIWAALVHLGALIFGAASRGWNASFKAVCYGSAPALLGVVPICGGFIGWIWSVVLAIVGLTFLQRTTAGRATGAVLVWILLVCCCTCAAIMALAGTGVWLTESGMN
ncbi:MAG: YIP1 family protein [Myxococcota bacterium]